jgi:hypothetical protein
VAGGVSIQMAVIELLYVIVVAVLIENNETYLLTQPTHAQGAYANQSNVGTPETTSFDDSPKCDTSALTNNRNPSATTAELITIFCNILFFFFRFT